MTYLRWLMGIALIGLFILVKPPESPDTLQSVSAQLEFDDSPMEGRDYVYYVVQPGDTVYGLVQKFRISTEESILQMNPHLRSERLTANERIRIPLE